MKLIPILAALTLVGCASTPIPVTLPTTPSITVSRDNGLMGGGCTNEVFVDGKSVGALNLGQSVTHHTTAGTHHVRVAVLQDGGMCASLTRTFGEQIPARVVQVDGPVHLRLYTNANGAFMEQVN